MLRTVLLLGCLAAACLGAEEQCALPSRLIREIQRYQHTVDSIYRRIVHGEFAGKTWESLLELTDTFGPRPTGSRQLEDAIDYAVEQMRADGLENVHTEDATVSHWERGREYAELVEPFRKRLPLLGLGSSVGTPAGGITGELVAVASFEEFEGLTAKQVAGKIVVFVPEWKGYGETVVYRRDAASVAATKGAIAALVRSIAPFSIGSPHTGSQNYREGVKKIPTACITVEDAELILRKYRKGERMIVRLEMGATNLDPIVSRNTVGELTGRIFKNSSVVVLSGHYDSWDVGTGAMDDGGGSLISWKAVTFLKAMGLRPKRTIRAVLWVAEEQGLEGVKGYERQHLPQEEDEFNVFFESDGGTFTPTGLDFSGNSKAQCIFREVAKLLKVFPEFSYGTSGVGSDVSQWTSRGFPGVSLRNKNENYFWYHHSEGDTMALEDSVALDQSTALWAATAYVIADLSVAIPKDVQPFQP